MTINKNKPLHARGRDDLTPFRNLFSARSSRPDLAISEDHIVSVIMARRGREAIFGKDLFSDPAWDILLELYAAYLAGRETSVSELAASIGTPPSTTTRWASALQAQGFVWCDEISEPKRTRIVLTAEGAARMKRLADYWGSAFVTI